MLDMETKVDEIFFLLDLRLDLLESHYGGLGCEVWLASNSGIHPALLTEHSNSKTFKLGFFTVSRSKGSLGNTLTTRH